MRINDTDKIARSSNTMHLCKDDDHLSETCHPPQHNKIWKWAGISQLECCKQNVEN